MRKRIISSIMCLAMLFTLIPTSAFALETSTETTPPETSEGTNEVETAQTKLAKAINDAKPGATVTLTEDVAVTGNPIEINKNLTLNLSGKKITGSISALVKVIQGTVTVTGGTIENSMTANGQGFAVDMKAGSSLTVENMTIKGSGGIFIRPDTTGNLTTTLNINNSSVTSTATDDNGFAAVTGNGNDRSKVIINVTGSTIDGAGTEGMYIPQAGSVTINSGAVKGYSAIGMKSGNLTIKGGTFNGTATAKGTMTTNTNGINCDGSVLCIDSNTAYSGKMNIDIQGGTFESKSAYIIHEVSANDATQILTLAISGGNFTSADVKTNNISDGPIMLQSAKVAAITGGTFNQTLKSDYLSAGYSQSKDVANGAVQKTTDKLVVKQPTVTSEKATAEIGGTYNPNATGQDSDITTTTNTVSFDLTTGTNGTTGSTKSTEVDVPTETAKSLSDGNVSTTIKTDSGDVTLDATAMGKIGSTTGKVVVTVEDKTPTTSGGSTPAPAKVIDVSIKNGNTNVLSSGASDNGTIKITVPVTLGNGQTKAYVYYGVMNSGAFKAISKIGEVAPVEGKVTFETTHLSTYAVYGSAQTTEDAAVADENGNVVNAGNLSDMLTAATAGQTVVLQKDVSLTGRVDVPQKAIKIDGQGHKIVAGDNFTVSSGTKALLQVEGGQVTFSDITLDANQKARVIFCKGGTLTLNDGVKVTNGKHSDQTCGGLVVTGEAKLVMNGGEITGNAGVTRTDETQKFLQNADDLWIGSQATAELKGGIVGKAFVNANASNTQGAGTLNISGATVDTVFVESQANQSGKLAVVSGGEVKNMLIALDYSTSNNGTDDDGNRVVASVKDVKPTGTDSKVEVGTLAIPAGVTATVVSGENLTKDITIPVNATLVIPADKTVKSTAKITNNGTLTVAGKLLSSGENDSAYVNIDGTGTIQTTGNGSIDFNKTDANAPKEVKIHLNLNGGSGAESEYTVYVQKDKTVTYTLPTLNREHYKFDKWTDEEGKTVTSVTLDGSKTEVTFTANWTYSGSTGGGGGVSSNVTIDRPTNGKVSITPTAPSKGATVTINLTPDTGYAVGTVTVTDKDGKAVELTKVNDTQYTFTMPDGKVTVKASFTKVDTPPATGFTDVAADAYYADAVKWAVDNGITNGLTATTFGPNNSCTRGQMVTFLWRAAGSPAATGTNSFSDVASGEYYYNAVLWAVEKGITNGTSATTFSPNATVNRAQTVTFLYRYAESPAATGDTSFTDVASSAYYADAVKWAVAEGITNGTSATTFAPASNCTRGQIVTFLYRQIAE